MAERLGGCTHSSAFRQSSMQQGSLGKEDNSASVEPQDAHTHKVGQAVLCVGRTPVAGQLHLPLVKTHLNLQVGLLSQGLRLAAQCASYMHMQ